MEHAESQQIVRNLRHTVLYESSLQTTAVEVGGLCFVR
ncbi:hypothetical protein YSA_08575 [Pseudomonas putida ND6]|uniref:Uncharacterized protein n=1 Tax=Pseudomonas putida ND6 TaxID=231023 RepID=I3V0Y2_PSEPU|nr:hypothetical protein YSA_08575 [Pseudomonas putida ND6]